MDYPKFIVPNQKEESISIQRVNEYFVDGCKNYKDMNKTLPDQRPQIIMYIILTTDVNRMEKIII